MNKEISKRWIDALPRYTQGRENLKTDDFSNDGFRHCCLGVLCELYAEETGEDIWGAPEGDESAYRCTVGTDGSHGYPPIAIAAWAEMTKTEENRLVQMNDTYGYEFARIAELIADGIPIPRPLVAATEEGE